jgi:hypothetical protein
MPYATNIKTQKSVCPYPTFFSLRLSPVTSQVHILSGPLQGMIEKMYEKKDFYYKINKIVTFSTDI